MKFPLVVVCLAVGTVLASDVAIDRVALARAQQVLNRLLYKVTEPLAYPELSEPAATFQPDADLSQYFDGGVAVKKILQEVRENRMLERNHWFSLFNPRHREEALMLFEVFVNCKTTESGINNAVYFRNRINEGEYIYASYASLFHSPLGKGFVFPPMYEVIPHLFTNSEVIQKAYAAQMTQTPGKFKMEFTGSQNNPEQRVAYFGEDIGMNVHHAMWHINFPFWWKDSYGGHLDRKGEIFFWAHHQLTVRFDAERLSNNLNVVEELYWDKPIREGFAPHTTYRYGGEFPTRPDNVLFEDIKGVIRVRDMIIHQNRIRDAIALGYITATDGSMIDIKNKEGIDRLGDIIESSLYSPNPEYYGALHNDAHVMLGRQADPQGKFDLPPSVMEHFETATRDPAFFRLHKYMDNIFKEHKDSLPPYTKEELEFPGVSLTRVEIDGELETFFDDFEFDLEMAVDTSESAAKVDVSAYVSRLNHNDFTYKFDITSTGEKHGVIRVFMCPTRDVNGIVLSSEGLRWTCIEMDKFWTKLTTGDNHIERKSSESSVTVPDIPSFKILMEETDKAISGDSDFDFAKYSRSCGIPNRMLLPKGTESGMEFSLIVTVHDGEEDDHESLENAEHQSHTQCGIHHERYPDHQPMGFPLDRRIDEQSVFFDAPNTKTILVKIFHRGSV